jgi:DNA polymerase III delta subunit
LSGRPAFFSRKPSRLSSRGSGRAEREEQVDLVSQHPYVVYQSLKNAGRFTRSELAGYLEMLVRIDLALKSTGQEPRLLLERFLLAVCGAVKVS